MRRIIDANRLSDRKFWSELPGGVAIVDDVRETAEDISTFYARRYNENVWDKDVEQVIAIIDRHSAATAPIAAPAQESK